MTADRRRGGGLKVIGLGALACVACCAGPLLAFLGGLSLAGLAATTVIGGAGLVIAVAAAIASVVVRRRRTLACALAAPEPVTVAAPTRRDTTRTEEVAVP